MRQVCTRYCSGIMLMIGLLAHGPLSSQAGAAEVIKVGGMGTALGSMRQIIAAFEKRYPGTAVRLMPSVGSSGAIKAVAEGALDIGLVGRPLKPEEQNPGLLVMEYARTPFVFAVNKSVKTPGLTSDDLVRIYRGEMQTWPNGERIRVVLRPFSDADTIFARTISPEMSAAIDDALAREGMIMAATNQECHDILDRTPGSLGFSSLTQILTEEHPLRPLTYNGTAPSVKAIAKGTYPLVKTLSLLTRAKQTPAVRRFVSFVLSAEGKAILERTGNLPSTGRSGN